MSAPERNGDKAVQQARRYGNDFSLGAPGIPAPDTIKSLNFKHKAQTSAYFSYRLADLMGDHEDTVPKNRLALLERELRWRGLLFKRIVTNNCDEGDRSGFASLLILSIDQQAARKLAELFRPDKAVWCNRTGSLQALLT
jgi:hypothetical protein